jgi:hypothetical protein
MTLEIACRLKPVGAVIAGGYLDRKTCKGLFEQTADVEECPGWISRLPHAFDPDDGANHLLFAPCARLLK